MNDEGPTLTVDNGKKAQDAFVIFQLYQGDVGQISGRTRHKEFPSRKPVCVSRFDASEVECIVTNVGTLSSDLLVFEHQFVFCTDPKHSAADGFTAIHAGEISSDPIDAILTAAYVAANSSAIVKFKVPQFQYAGLANLYFRCRNHSGVSRRIRVSLRPISALRLSLWLPEDLHSDPENRDAALWNREGEALVGLVEVSTQ